MIALVCGLVACGSQGSGRRPGGGGNTPAPGDGGGGGVTSGQFSIRSSDESWSGPEGATPMAGRRFFSLYVTIENRAEAQSVRASFALFSIRTGRGLTIAASSASSRLAPLCAADVSVSTGGSFNCRLAFEVPSDDAPVSLLYSDAAAMRSASAPVTAPPLPMDACSAWTRGMTGACAECLQASGCIETIFVCEGDIRCLDQSTGCFRQKPDCPVSQGCAQGLKQYQACVVEACDSVCR